MNAVKIILAAFLIFLLSTSPCLPSTGTANRPRVSEVQTRKPVKRALLVGINKYVVPQEARRGAGRPPATNMTARVPKSTNRRLFSNLEGPTNDVKALARLLKTEFGFTAVVMLSDEQATKVGILRAFEEEIINASSAGDVCLFYYSGHGSQRVNSRSDEDDKRDETIVPQDAAGGVKDIRDKELARLYHRAINKGVNLIVISDSCHSGSNARGIDTSRIRTVGLDTDDAREAPDACPHEPARRCKSPEERGALVLSASQDFEAAKEKEFEGEWHGAFSYELLQVLGSGRAHVASAEEVFQEIRVRMKGRGERQEPVIAGTPERRLRKTLFGEEARPLADRSRVRVTEVTAEGSVGLGAGQADGVNVGSEFAQVTDGTDAPPVRIRVVEVLDLSASRAIVLNAAGHRIKSGDVFEQDRWAAPAEARLTIWMPPATLSAADIKTTVRDLSPLRASERVEWVADPTVDAATHLIYFDESGWKLKSPTALHDLGTRPTAKAALEKLTGDAPVKLFLYLPPPRELRELISIGSPQKNAVAVAQFPGTAMYQLVGRVREKDSLEYAWTLPAATEKESMDRAPAERKRSSAPKPDLWLPPVTQWVAAGSSPDENSRGAATLDDLALRLGKIRGWIKLPLGAPPDNGKFPYRLVIRKDGNTLNEGATLVGGQTYQMFMVADENRLAHVEPRWVYVLNIDRDGNSSLLYGEEQGNFLPRENISGSPASEIHLGTFAITSVEEHGVFGPEAFIFVSTRNRIPAPGVLRFEGVSARPQGERRATDPLTELLIELGSATRTSPATPGNWSAQHLFFKSVPEK